MSTFEASAEDNSARARRRKSLAHAMKLVDAAIANLESVAPTSPRRRPRTANPLLGNSIEGSDEPPDLAGAHALLAALQQRCSSNNTNTNSGSGRGSAEVTAGEVATLQAALAGQLADQGRRALAVSSFSAAPLAAALRARRAAQPLPLLRSWAFDVFACAVEHPAAPMATVGLALYEDAGLVDHFGLDATKLVKFLAELERGYLPTNRYHNALHGLDVGQTMHYFLHGDHAKGGGHGGGLGDACTPQERLVALTAALAHDVGHWGYTNGWLVATHDPLALQYHYNSPLESMHAAKALQLLATEGCDFWSGLEAGLLSPQDAQAGKQLLVAMVLATDMANHGADLGRLQAKLSDSAAAGGSSGTWALQPGELHQADRALALKVALHAADVSNPAKPWLYYNAWTDRVLDEFFAQGDAEQAAGLPVSTGFDRAQVTCAADKARGQLGFINFVVAPLYAALAQIEQLDLQGSATKCLAENTAAWQAVVDAAD